jgi:hypothetical protein
MSVLEPALFVRCRTRPSAPGFRGYFEVTHLSVRLRLRQALGGYAFLVNATAPLAVKTKLLLLRHNLIFNFVVRRLRDDFLLHQLILPLVWPAIGDFLAYASPMPVNAFSSSGCAELMSSGWAAYAQTGDIDSKQSMLMPSRKNGA